MDDKTVLDRYDALVKRSEQCAKYFDDYLVGIENWTEKPDSEKVLKNLLAYKTQKERVAKELDTLRAEIVIQLSARV